MKIYAGILVSDGQIRRLKFQAMDEVEAARLALKMGVGLEGEATADEDAPPREFYPEKLARFVLGDISRTTLYKMLVVGQLERMPGMRRVLISRKSIERLIADI